MRRRPRCPARTPPIDSIRHRRSTAPADLPDRQRSIAALYYLDDLSVADISDTLDIAEGTVRFHLSQARAHGCEPSSGSTSRREPTMADDDMLRSILEREARLVPMRHDAADALVGPRRRRSGGPRSSEPR